MNKELEELMRIYSGLLSRMKERDGNEKLKNIIDREFLEELKK